MSTVCYRLLKYRTEDAPGWIEATLDRGAIPPNGRREFGPGRSIASRLLTDAEVASLSHLPMIDLTTEWPEASSLDQVDHGK